MCCLFKKEINNYLDVLLRWVKSAQPLLRMCSSATLCRTKRQSGTEICIWTILVWIPLMTNLKMSMWIVNYLIWPSATNIQLEKVHKQ